MPSTELSEQARVQLLSLARRSIERSLTTGRMAPFDEEVDLQELQEPGATFVTLREGQTLELRGCCGTLEASAPLAEDVWRNAWASAFADPRFAPLSPDEWPDLDLHISVLSAPEPFEVSSEEELLRTLRPGVDGLVLEYRHHRATFLPAVWEQLPNPRDFLRHLRAKAGLPPDFWSPDIRWAHYVVEEIGEEESSGSH